MSSRRAQLGQLSNVYFQYQPLVEQKQKQVDFFYDRHISHVAPHQKTVVHFEISSFFLSIIVLQYKLPMCSCADALTSMLN